MNGIHHQRRRLAVSIKIGVLGLALGLTQPVALAQTDAVAKPLLEEASAAVASGNYVYALAVHANAIAASPDDPAVYTARAQLFDRLDQPGLASADYRIAVKLKPDDAGTQGNLCRSLALANHDLDGALAACNAAVRLAPQSPDALSARGYLQLRRAAYAEAEKDYSAAINLSPASPDNMFGFGLALIHLGRVKDGRGEIASATLDSSGVVSDWKVRGFGLQGEIFPGRPLTKASQPITSLADQMPFLNKGETYVKLANGCGRVATIGDQPDASSTWSGACRFGLLHGEGKLSSSPSDTPATRFSYGREIAADEAGAAIAQKLDLAYQAVEKALTP